MTREEAKEMLPVIQAYAEGKTIQYWISGDWIDVEVPSFSRSPDEYRIKPEEEYGITSGCHDKSKKPIKSSWFSYDVEINTKDGNVYRETYEGASRLDVKHDIQDDFPDMKNFTVLDVKNLSDRYGDPFFSSKKYGKLVKSSRMIKSSHTWDDFDKFENLDKYLPSMGDGDNKGTQAATAVSKLVYKWFNDGDVFDNNYGLTGWENDISGSANWLEKYVRAASPILATIEDIGSDEDEYTELLYDLCEAVDPLIPELAEEPKEGNAYDEDGPYSFSEKYEDEDW